MERTEDLLPYCSPRKHARGAWLLNRGGARSLVKQPYTQRRRSIRSSVTIMAAPVARRLGRLTSNSCYFFLCDMQEKFRSSIRYYPEIITVAQRMVRLKNRVFYHSPFVRRNLLQVRAANILKIPVIATEQYPKG